MITGAPRTIDDQEHLVLIRTFRAPIDDVWAALTESDRLARWFGSWSGDPATGRVEVAMIFEGDGPAEDYIIEVCEAPTRLRVHNDNPDAEQVWTLDLRLSHAAGVTTLDFAQVLTDRTIVVHVGPGWEYYLDRLDDSLRTGEVASTEWDGYMDLSRAYAAAFGLPDPDTEVLRVALDQAAALIRAGAERTDAPTPCPEWTVRDLSAHLVTTTTAFTRGVLGEQVDWTAPPAPVDGDVVEAFSAASAGLLAARDGLGEKAEPPDWQLAEYAVHTWDLATALGRPTADLDPQIAERGGAFMRANLTAENRAGAFAPEQPASDGADAYAALAAFAGRRVG